MNNIPELLARVASGDPSAADDLDALSEKLKNLASRLRSGSNGYTSPGALCDRVQMQVVGPDGQVRVTTEGLS